MKDQTVFTYAMMLRLFLDGSMDMKRERGVCAVEENKKIYV